MEITMRGFWTLVHGMESARCICSLAPSQSPSCIGATFGTTESRAPSKPCSARTAKKDETCELAGLDELQGVRFA